MDRSKLIRRIVRMDRRAKGNQERRRKERKNEERGRERKRERESEREGGREKGWKVNWRNVKEEWFDETHGRINSRNSRRRHSTAFSELRSGKLERFGK